MEASIVHKVFQDLSYLQERSKGAHLDSSSTTTSTTPSTGSSAENTNAKKGGAAAGPEVGQTSGIPVLAIGILLLLLIHPQKGGGLFNDTCTGLSYKSYNNR